MRRLISLCYGAAFLAAAAVLATGQASNDVASLVAKSQYDLAANGREFLLERVSHASFVLVGGLHGDNETQGLLQLVMGGLGDGGSS